MTIAPLSEGFSRFRSLSHYSPSLASLPKHPNGKRYNAESDNTVSRRVPFGVLGTKRNDISDSKYRSCFEHCHWLFLLITVFHYSLVESVHSDSVSIGELLLHKLGLKVKLY